MKLWLSADRHKAVNENRPEQDQNESMKTQKQKYFILGSCDDYS